MNVDPIFLNRVSVDYYRSNLICTKMYLLFFYRVKINFVKPNIHKT